MKTVTMKFGGTSVGNAKAISNVVQIVCDDINAGNRVVVVVSAMSGVTESITRSALRKWTCCSMGATGGVQ